MTKTLYKIPLDEASQVDGSDTRGSRLAEAGVLDGSAAVDQLSSTAPDYQLEGQFRTGPWHARLSATELKELANSSISTLPLFREGESPLAEAGYYEIDSADAGPVHANAEDVYSWRLGLKKKGTRHEYYRKLETSPTQIDHEFGTDLGSLVAIPASARKVQWFDEEGTARAPADSVGTRSGEFGDVDLYDLDDGEDAVGAEDPSLIYDIGYADERWTDCRAYDTLGVDEKYISNDEGRVRVWEAVYHPGHDPEGDLVFVNGHLRVRFAEGDGTITAQRWDLNRELLDSGLYGEGIYGEGIYYGSSGTGGGKWVDVDLDQPAGAELFDVDIETIAMARNKAQLTFNVDGSLFALTAILLRGTENVLFDIPPNETGPIPVTLEEWLRPIASETIVDMQPEKTLVSRSKVRR